MPDLATACRLAPPPLEPPPIPLMRAAGLIPVLGFLARIGAPLERLLAHAGLEPGAFADPESLIPVHQGTRFMEESARREGIASLGLLAGTQASLEALGTFGRLVRWSDTLHAALTAAARYFPFFSSGQRLWFRRSPGHVRIFLKQSAGAGGHSPQADQYSLMLLVNIVRLAAGPSWQPGEVRLESGRPAGRIDADVLAHAWVAFDQVASSIVFDRQLLDHPVAAAPANRTPDLADLGRWLGSGPAATFPGSVSQVIDMLSGRTYPQPASIAARIGMNVRTLQRHLTKAGTSCQDLVMRCRLSSAIELLRDTDSRIVDIALDLGYSDHAHFTRAFRKWTGSSPREFRLGSRHPQPRAVRKAPRRRPESIDASPFVQAVP